MDNDVTTDVAIVGYGPTGQLLALLLGRLGHRVTVIDRWPDLYPLPRAVHFDHEIARILQAAGVINDVTRVAEVIDTYQWRNADREMLLELDWRGMGPSGWPISNMFSQPELERVLHRHVQTQPTVALYQGWSVIAMAQDDHGVTLEMEHGEVHDGVWAGLGERRNVRARWVIGADGANSTIRRLLGVEMHDLGFAFDWLVVDVLPHEEREWNPKTWQLCDPVRPTTVVPGGPGRRRWEFMLLPGETALDMNQAEVAWQLLEPWDITPENARLERHAVYTFRGQWALEWQRGRVLLAGDAAHLMPPFAGQGMCSGMRDSMALSWRLDAMLRGLVPASILDSYGPERSGHVQELIGFSIELGKVICITDPEVARQRDTEMLSVRAQPDFQPPPPPQPRLGDGLWHATSPGAGTLGIQGEVEVNGRRDRFDDIFGVRFALIARDADVLQGISAENHAALERIGAAVVHIGAGGMADVKGSYAGWLEQLGCTAVLMRPDFYLQGGATNATELNTLLDAWRQALAVAA